MLDRAAWQGLASDLFDQDWESSPGIGRNSVGRTRWLSLLGFFLVVTTLCCLLACVSVGLLWWRSGSSEIAATDPPPARTPTLTVVLAQATPTSAEQETARRLDAAALPQRNLLALARSLQSLPKATTTAGASVAPDYAAGDEQAFWLHDVETMTFFTTTAVLRYETDHAYWWVEQGYEVSTPALERSARSFEERTYPTNQRIFGSEWSPGIDGDPHVYIFLGNVPGVGGYFSGPDEYPRSIRPHSNQHEMFYVSLDNAQPGNDYFDGILAHEHQHMIHWAMDRNEDTWINEGLSELAGQINGYDVGGSDIEFSARPDTQLTTWPELEDSGPNYGASYLFMAYFLEQYGEDAVRQLVAEPANGAAGFDAVLQELDPDGRRFDDLFADWVIANYLDDPASAQKYLGYADLRVEQPVLAARHTAYPVRSQATVHQYAADYVLLEGSGELAIEFEGSPVAPLVGNEPHGGDYQWWALRGDEGDATLTRAFDLSGLEQATLQAWMWYDLEADFDYAYVEASTDGGQTWDLLTSEHTTATNPNGNGYGPGFTSLSGGGDEPRWEQETFDLAPYAGQQVLVRFQVITDESVNHPGLCLDDITVPELGYLDDAETDAGGWQAEGWLRVTEWIPQQFVVQVITLGREPRVERMILDEQQRGTLTVAEPDRQADRVLVVSALAPVTTVPAIYEYRVTRR